MRFEVIDDGTGFDRAMDALDEEAADRREANIANALAKALEEQDAEVK